MASLDDAFNQLKIANQHLTAIDNDLQTVNASVKAVGVDSQATTAAVQAGFSGLYSLVNYTTRCCSTRSPRTPRRSATSTRLPSRRARWSTRRRCRPRHNRRCERISTISSSSTSWPTRPPRSNSPVSRSSRRRSRSVVHQRTGAAVQVRAVKEPGPLPKGGVAIQSKPPGAASEKKSPPSRASRRPKPAPNRRQTSPTRRDERR